MLWDTRQRVDQAHRRRPLLPPIPPAVRDKGETSTGTGGGTGGGTWEGHGFGGRFRAAEGWTLGTSRKSVGGTGGTGGTRFPNTFLGWYVCDVLHRG